MTAALRDRAGGLQVRPLQAADPLEALTALLHRGYARLGAMGLNYTAVDQSVQTTARRLAAGQGFVALWHGDLVGTVLAQGPDPDSDCALYRQADVASLRQLAVEPAMQGRGIGRALVEAAVQWARGAGYRRMALDTAEPAEHLVRLYAGLGFQPEGGVQWPGKCYRSVVMAMPL